MRNMKYVLTGLMILLSLTGCYDREGKQGAGEPWDTLTIRKPEKHLLSGRQLQDQIDKEIKLAVEVGKDYIIEEAANVIRLTRMTAVALRNKDYSKARQNINKAIARAKLISTGKPEDSKATASLNVELQDRAQDIRSVLDTRKRIDSLMEIGHIQAVRRSIPGLASEINISRESISIPATLEVLESAESMIGRKEYEKAMAALGGILDRIVVEHRTIPLPLIRARRMVAEMENQLDSEKIPVEDLRILLDNAEYQIRFAEILGYGMRTGEYPGLYKNIGDIRDGLDEEDFEKVSKLAEDLRKEIRTFKDHISEYEYRIAGNR